MSIFASTDLKTFLFRPIVAQVICIFFIVLLCIDLISFAVQRWQTTTKNAVNAPLLNERTPQQQVNDEMKLRWPLFGEYLPKQFGDMQIKRSTLDLRVVGILYSTRTQDSQVILRTASGVEQPYKIGDTLPGGATIKQISADGVLVMHKGELESLSLPKNKLIFEPPSKGLFHGQ